jgi:small-conductance mechanosensitive channel
LIGLALLAGLCACAGTAAAQPAAAAAGQPLSVERTDQSAQVSFFNRTVVVLRARVAGRSPADRALGTERRLRDAAEADGPTEPIDLQRLQDGVLITVASRGVLFLASADVDDLGGDTLDSVAAQAVDQLREAFSEAADARRPRVLLRAAAVSVVAIVAGLFLLVTLVRARTRITSRLSAAAERRLAAAGVAPLQGVPKARMLGFEQYAVAGAVSIANLVIAYAVSTFVLRQFPFTRAWGESMRAFFLSTVANLALGAARTVPGLTTVAIIFVFSRLATRLAAMYFNAVERGELQSRWIHPETAQPSRRLFGVLVWVFAVIVAYPYMPGSQTDAFKGVTVFLGLIVTFGSSGLVNHIMSGFMITYSRSLRVGDFVRIGDVLGTVTRLGVLSTKVTTLYQEEVTIPNAVVVSTTTTDYSRLADEGVFTTTSVTIGYDTPWRQVHALLLRAAERTPGLRHRPAPAVVQESLQDFYVKYTLMVCLEQQSARLQVLNELHANIQDLFNEYGVQIMSPNYVLDPAAPKLVPREQWFAAPASNEQSS